MRHGSCIERTGTFMYRPEHQYTVQVIRAVVVSKVLTALVMVTATVVVMLISDVASVGLLDKPYAILISLAVLSLLLAQAFLQGSAILVIQSDIVFHEGELRLHLLRDYAVTVKDMKRIKRIIRKKIRLRIGRDDYRRPVKEVYVVEVSGLSVFHILTGLRIGLGLTPVFLITKDHDRYEELLTQLQRAMTPT